MTRTDSTTISVISVSALNTCGGTIAVRRQKPERRNSAYTLR